MKLFSAPKEISIHASWAWVIKEVPWGMEEVSLVPRIMSLYDSLLRMEHVANTKVSVVRKPFGEHIAILAFTGSLFKVGKISCSLTLGTEAKPPLESLMGQVPKRKLKPIRCSVLLWNSPVWVLSTPHSCSKPKRKHKTKHGHGAMHSHGKS